MARTRGRPEVVGRDTLIAATLRMIGNHGIEAVTMRRLAAELGVSPMAAYRHVGSKDELLRLAAAEVVRGIEVLRTGSWQDDLTGFFVIFYERLLAHPGVAGLFAGPAFLSDVVYEVSEPTFASLLAAGFDPENAVALFMACAACTIGAATLASAAPHQAAHHHGPGNEPVPERHPSISKIIPYLSNHDPAARHRQALRGIVAGYAAETRG